MRSAVLLLLCLGCSSGAPTIYNQGVFRPAPPVFIPSQDAPHTIGQPGHLQPQRHVEPNPRHKRPLPPAREPGVWAGDGPPSTKAEPVTLLDITIPTPPEATEEIVSVARMCSYWYADGLINNAEHARRVMALTKEQRLCLVVDIMNVCMRIAFNPDMSSAREAEHTRKVLAHMNDATKKTCRAHKDAIRDLASSIIAVTSNRWNKLPQGPLQ